MNLRVPSVIMWYRVFTMASANFALCELEKLFPQIHPGLERCS